MTAHIEVIEDKLYIGGVADELIASVRDVISEKGSCSLVLSGGSTPGAIYRTLTKPPRDQEVDWSKVDFFWGDERWVSQDNVQSNYRMAKETLLSQINVSEPREHAVDTSLETPEKGALAYAKNIRHVLKVADSSLPIFDIVLLGIGEDGHTASIFPQSSVLHEDSLRVCAAVEHPDGSMRITLLPEVLFSAKKVLFIVRGESKAEILKRVIEGQDDVSAIPARLYLKHQDRVTFFVDSSAASMLAL